MRTLHSALLAEQKKKTRKPYLRVLAFDTAGGIPRLHWEQPYSGAEPAGPHALAASGPIILRFRVHPATNILYRNRDLDGYGVWYTFRTATRLTAAAAQSGTPNVLAFAVDNATPTQIYWCASADAGSSWSTWALLCTAAGTITHIAATSKANGDTLVVFAVGATVYKIKRVSASWGAITAWTNTVATVTGLAAHHWLDYNLIITGTAQTTLDPTVCSCIYGDGYFQAADTWSALRPTIEATAGSAVAYSAPSVTYADTWRASYRHTFTGTVAYDRIDLIHAPIAADFVDNTWAEPRPFDLDHDYGLALAYTADHVWATTPNKVFIAPIPTALDLTPDVLSCVAHDYPFDPRGATIRLRNDDGRYNTPGAGALTALSRGARIDIAPGYYCPGLTPKYSFGPSYYIDTIDHVSAPGRRELVIHAGSTWDLLARWRPGRPYRWPAGTRNYFQLISIILAKMGLEFSGFSSTAKLTDDFPDFAIVPGYDPPPYISGWQRTFYPYYGWITRPIWTDPPPVPATQQLPLTSGLSAIQQLYSHLEDRIYPRQDLLYNLWPQAADASVYAFGTYHAILAATYRSVAPANRFLAFGDADLSAEAIDYPAVDLLHDRPRVVHDKAMTTAADVTGRATREARDATIFSRADVVAVPPHCGIELWDVVDVTDPSLALSAAKRRVTGITLVFDRSATKPAYHQVLTLGEP